MKTQSSLVFENVTMHTLCCYNGNFIFWFLLKRTCMSYFFNTFQVWAKTMHGKVIFLMKHHQKVLAKNIWVCTNGELPDSNGNDDRLKHAFPQSPYNLGIHLRLPFVFDPSFVLLYQSASRIFSIMAQNRKPLFELFWIFIVIFCLSFDFQPNMTCFGKISKCRFANCRTSVPRLSIQSLSSFLPLFFYLLCHVEVRFIFLLTLNTAGKTKNTLHPTVDSPRVYLHCETKVLSKKTNFEIIRKKKILLRKRCSNSRCEHKMCGEHHQKQAKNGFVWPAGMLSIGFPEC